MVVLFAQHLQVVIKGNQPQRRSYDIMSETDYFYMLRQIGLFLIISIIFFHNHCESTL